MKWMGNGFCSPSFTSPLPPNVREWTEACKVNWMKKPSKCRSNNINTIISIRRMTTTATTTTATTSDRPTNRPTEKKTVIQAWRMRKYFDFAQSLYLQNLIILYVFYVHLFAFHLFIHRRLSMNFCNVYEAAAAATATEEKKTFSPHRFNFLPPSPSLPLPMSSLPLLFLILPFARLLAFHFSAHLHGICLPCRPHITMPWHCWILLIVHNGERKKNATLKNKNEE